jgi:site-specific recombinase XerD
MKDETNNPPITIADADKTSYSIRQLHKSVGNMTWYGCIYVSGQKTKHISLGTDSKLLAEKWLTKMKFSEMMPPSWRREYNDYPMAKAAEEYLQYVQSLHPGTTYKTYKSRIHPCVEFMQSQGCVSLRQITKGMVLKLVASFPQHRRMTLHERFRSFRLWLRWCAKQYEMGEYNPCDGIVIHVPFDKENEESWSEEEIQRIIDAAPSTLYRLFVGLMAYAGLRLSEALNLRVEDIHRDTKEIAIVGKANKYAVVPISDKLWSLYTAVMDELHPEGRFFPPDKFEQHSPELVAIFRYVLARAGLPMPKKSLHHRLRHSYCTNLIRAGVDLKTVTRLMRHSDVRISLNVYTHISDDAMRDGVNRI